jgi:hypothetical protein
MLQIDPVYIKAENYVGKSLEENIPRPLLSLKHHK